MPVIREDVTRIVAAAIGELNQDLRLQLVAGAANLTDLEMLLAEDVVD